MAQLFNALATGVSPSAGSLCIDMPKYNKTSPLGFDRPGVHLRGPSGAAASH